MNTESKLMTATEAVRQFMKNGNCVSLGGFTISRNPMVLVHEVIRQGITDLHVVMHSGSQALDILVGAGHVKLLEIAYGANGRLASTCVRFRKATQSGEIKVEDYTNYQMTLRFMAGAMGVPFLPTYSSLGTDIISRWGFDAEFRKSQSNIPQSKLIVIDNPFCDSSNPVVLIPAVNPDVTILHAQKASEDGTVRLEGLTFADIEQARSSRHVIVSCEELVSNEQLRQESWNNSIPHVLVDAVVHQPYGAHPTACYQYYDYDVQHLIQYRTLANDDSLFQSYLDRHILNVKSFDEYLELIGQDKLQQIKASPGIGYARRSAT